jgi:cytochrome b
MPQQSTDEVKVWDLPVRLFHWTLALSFLLCFLSEDDLPLIHINAGYLMGGLLIFRLLWGFIGSPHARFGDFVQRPAAVLIYLRESLHFQAPRHLGHNPAGGAMVIALMSCLSLTVLSGLALYGATDFAGPLAGWFRGGLAADILEAVHEFLANFSLVLIGLHLGGVLFSSLAHGENLVKSMFNGMKKVNPHE